MFMAYGCRYRMDTMAVHICAFVLGNCVRVCAAFVSMSVCTSESGHWTSVTHEVLVVGTRHLVDNVLYSSDNATNLDECRDACATASRSKSCITFDGIFE